MKKFLSLALCAAMLLVLMPILTKTVSAESLSKFDIRLDEPIASHNPDFSPVFNTNAYVYSKVTWQENSPGFSAKLNSSDEFKAGLAYKVEIWILLGDGNYFPVDGYGDLATAITVNGKAISSLKINGRNSQNQITEVTITCEYGPLSGMAISSALVKGVPTPVAGNMPIYSFTLGSSNAYYFYHTQPIVWWDKTTGKEMDSGDTFVQGHRYQVEIWLAANRENGYTFKVTNGKPAVNVTLNSFAPDSVVTAYEQDPREVIAISYTFPACKAAHTCAPKLVPQQDPTCLMYGFKAYYECSCGKCFEDAAGKKEITDMDGYGILAALGHTWSPTYLYKDSTGHAWICATCKEHSTIEKHNPGPAATEKTPQTCKDCGYVITPVKNHTHDLTRVPATPADCMNGGNIQYYFCTGCNDCFTDAQGKNKIPSTQTVETAPLGHKASDSWGFNEQFHWRNCTRCGIVLAETKMAHEDVGGKCATCGYAMGSGETSPVLEPTLEMTEPTQDTAPTEDTQPTEIEETVPPQNKNSKGSGISPIVIVLVALVCFGAGITATVIIMKNKKK